MNSEIDLGHGVKAIFFRSYASKKIIGAILTHPKSPQCTYGAFFENGQCSGAIYWDEVTDRPQWKLKSLNPLHVDPSVQCKCKAWHGFIHDGKSVPV